MFAYLYLLLGLVLMRTVPSFGSPILPMAVSSRGDGAVDNIPDTYIIEEGSTILLKCSAHDDVEDYDIHWHLSGRCIGTSRQLTITSVTRKDEGVYNCITHGPNGQTVTDFFVYVFYGPVVEVDQKQVELDVAAKVTIECRVSAKPRPKLIQWLKIGDPHFVVNGSVLQIEEAKFEDRGRYVCRATNIINGLQHSGSADVQISVRHPPGPVLVVPKISVVLPGEKLKMSCSSNPVGLPQPTFRWWKKGMETKILAVSSTLIISSVEAKDAGVYYCEVANRLGSGVGLAHLKVEQDRVLYASDDRLRNLTQSEGTAAKSAPQAENVQYNVETKVLTMQIISDENLEAVIQLYNPASRSWRVLKVIPVRSPVTATLVDLPGEFEGLRVRICKIDNTASCSRATLAEVIDTAPSHSK